MKRTLLGAVMMAAALSSTACDEPDETGLVRSATLTRAKSCGDLLSRLKDDARVKMNDAIDRQIAYVERRETDAFGAPGQDGSTSAGTGGSSAGAEDTGSGGGAPEHSETNTQVEGVDEADIVKTDGHHLYVLHGDELAIVDAWPISDLALGSTTEIEGSPYEMFVTAEQAVVFSRVSAAEVLGELGIACDSTSYDHDSRDDRCWSSFTKLTVVGIDGSEPAVLDEHYLEGWYESSRRVGSQVRTVVSAYGHHGPNVRTYPEHVDPERWDDVDYMRGLYEQLRRENEERIAAASLDDFLPMRLSREGEGLKQLAPSCTDYYLPGSGTTDYGMTTIASLDLSGLDAGMERTSIMGDADTVYASKDALYVAGRSWNLHRQLAAFDSAEPISTSATHLHKLDTATDPAKPRYVASATVPGRLNDQFSLDEQDGVLRVVTTDTLASDDEWESVNHLFTLGPSLNELGAVTDLAPGESVFSARFVGDRGYVVTFRQIDPLFVFDLTNPSAPKKLAELKIPGFSTYMHPIEGGDYLLTIGYDGDDGGTITNPALQLFDVRNPTSPQLAHKLVLEDGWSEAGYDHKAFTFYGGMLTIPFSSYDEQDWTLDSSLLLFDVDAESGIQKRGEIDHSGFFPSGDEPADPYCYAQGAMVRRGVFIEDALYSISNGGVMVNDVETLEPLASLELPSVLEQQCGYY